MVATLRSYVEGRWFEGTGTPRDLHDPTTEEVLARTSTEGIDFATALAYARETGGHALRALTFAERGGLLAKASKALHGHRDALLDLSTRSGGNTRGDAKFDVDGATGTMMFYAKLGEGLGDRKVLLDGDMEQLTRAPRYVGQHVWVPRRGVAVHVNAFNFPAWGMGEKLGVSILAGMPVVVKPATSTALLAHRMVEILVEEEVFPAGVLSFVCGSPGDMVEHLSDQDVLAFTGSADTGATLRSSANVIRDSVRVNVEADSLNAAVLGPDVESDSATYDLFLREVAKDMTQKAGQKCTAIRRVMVPEDRVDQVAEDLGNELAGVKVGDPSAKGVRMGPLATASQLRDVAEGLGKLREHADMVHGDGGRGELVGVEGEKGYFLSPVLLKAKDSHAAVFHELEVFGPVATLLPYSGKAEDAVALVQKGKGGLVSSVYSDDRRFVEEVVLGIAPYLGRVTVGSARVAEHSPGPGTVLPQLVHGGPGRAGGGEELGGLRGLRAYQQRTAVQGSKPLLEKILGASPE